MADRPDLSQTPTQKEAMAVSKETLAKIHELLANEMVERLEAGSVVRDKEGDLVAASITAAEMNVIRQFLKDNGIDQAVSDSDVANPFDKLVLATNNDLTNRFSVVSN